MSKLTPTQKYEMRKRIQRLSEIKQIGDLRLMPEDKWLKPSCNTSFHLSEQMKEDLGINKLEKRVEELEKEMQILRLMHNSDIVLKHHTTNTSTGVITFV